MTHLSRRLIFYCLVLVFVISAPLVILYAKGYVFDFGKYKFVKTGTLILQSEPKNADVYIDDKLIGQTPLTINRLSPKFYNIKISKNEYSTWQKNLEIKPELITEATKILLILKNPKIESTGQNLTDGSLRNYLLSSNEKQQQSIAQNLMQNKFQGITDWEIVDSTIYFIKKSNYILYKMNIDGTNETQLSFQPLAEQVSYQLFASPDKQIAVLSQNNSLYLLDNGTQSFKKIASGVKSAEFSFDSNKLLYYSANEIWVYRLDDSIYQPRKLAGEKELITRFGETISYATWYGEDNEHIFFAVSNRIKVIELDDRNHRNITDLISTTDAPQLVYRNNKLFFTSKETINFISFIKSSLF